MALIGECVCTKVTKKKSMIENKFQWKIVHQKAFSKIKQLLAHNIVLTYPNFELPFEITLKQVIRGGDCSKCQADIFHRKLSNTQWMYTITENELLHNIKTQKEFRWFLFGQQMKVITDNKNLLCNALGLGSSWAMRWKLLLKEYRPKIVHIAATTNTKSMLSLDLTWILPNPTCKVSDDILEGLDENNYLQSKHVLLTRVVL